MKKLLLLITAILALIPPLRAEFVQHALYDNALTTNRTQALKQADGAGYTVNLTMTNNTGTSQQSQKFRSIRLVSGKDMMECDFLYDASSIRPGKSGTKYLSAMTKGNKMVFRALYGKIQKIELIVYRPTLTYGDANKYFKITNGSINYSGSTMTVTATDGAQREIVIDMNTVNTQYIYAFSKINVTWEPGTEAVKPGLVTVFNGKDITYDESDGVYHHTVASPGFTVDIPENTERIFYTLKDDLKAPALNQTTASKDPKLSWVLYKYGMSWTSTQDDCGIEKTLRVVPMNSSFVGEETKVKIILDPVPMPEVLESELLDGMKYKVENGKHVLEYANYDQATANLPYVKFNFEGLPSATKLYYTFDGTDPTTSSSKLDNPAYQVVSLNLGTNPVNNQETLLKAKWHNGSFMSETLDLYFRKVGAAAPVAPVVSGCIVDGVSVSSPDAGKAVRIKETVGFNLGIGGQVEVYEKYFDHEPTGAELSNTSDFTKAAVDTDKGDLLTVTKDKIDVANGKTGCWLALVSRRSNLDSRPTVIHIALQGPADPSLKPLCGYMQDKKEFTILPTAFRSLLEVDDNTTAVKYQFLQETNGVTPTVPDPDKWESLDITGGSAEFDSKKITDNGRLFLIAQAPLEGTSAMTSSDCVYYDFTYLRPVRTTLGQKSQWDTGQLGENQLVVIDEPLRVMGFYATNAVNSPYYMYLMNRDGNVIKVSGMSTDGADWPDDIKALADKDLMATPHVMPAGSVVGRIHFNDDKDFSELQATQGIVYGSENLTPLFGVPAIDNGWALSAAGEDLHHPADRKEVSRANDFGRYVELRSLKYLGGSNEFEMADKENSRMYLYRRLNVTLADRTLEKDKLYRVKGFIGLADGKLSIFPVADIEQCPGTPNLFAPNPIKPGVDDTDADGRILVRAVSDKVEIRAEGHAFGASKFFYTRSDRKDEGMIPVDDATKKFVIDLAYGADINVDVYAQLGDMTSLTPARIRVVKKESVKVESINDFKTRELASPSTGTIYQLDKDKGQVIIEEITDKYLYVRDYNADPAQQLADDDHMNRLLILNTNGWKAKVADAGDENAEPRELKKGDVITNFAIVPTHDRGNLMSDAKGFARTFRLVGNDKDATGSAMPIELDQITDFKFTPEYRMRFVELKGAKVHRENNDGADKDLYPYNYTITNIDGAPTMRMDVFVRSGFAEAYSDDEDVRFNLTGIVMLDSESGDITDTSKFALALQSFTGSGKLAVPQVFIGGSSDSGKENISYNKPGTITMTAPTGTADGGVLAEGTEVKLYYALGGIDPLKDIRARREYQGKDWDATDMELGDGDVEIRVFAAAPGMTPSDVVVRRFKKESHDMQFILNFLETAKAGEYYRFTGDTRIVAVGGEYMFVAGRVGHYLPIHLSRGWDGLGMTPGMMLTDFTVGYTVDEHGNRMATADGFTDTFNPTAASADEKLKPVPDEATALSYEDHPRRLVRLKGVKVKAPVAAAVAEDGITEWDVIEQGDNETHVMPVGKLGDVKIQDAKDNIEAEFIDGESYDIVGFVMLNDSREAKMEIWPVEARHLSRVAEVQVNFSAGTTRQVNSAGEIEAAFDGMTTVELSCDTRGARILYAFGYDNSNLTWYEYQGRPLTVTANEYIHAKAEADNAVESDHTHIVLKRKDMASDVTFSVDDSTPGKAVVTLSAAPGAKIFWWTALNGKEALYDQAAPVILEETDMVFAYATESGKVDGRVCSKFVKVAGGESVDPSDPEQPADRVSGRVVFSLDNSGEGKVKVNIEPETMPEGDWDIYYTTDPDVILTKDTGTRYEGAFEVTESSLVMAILVEHSRPEAEATVCEVYVWVAPTGIDSVGTDSADSVRADGDRIIAPEGSVVYDLNARRVRPEGLRSGIYIVRTPDGKAVKVAIR